MYSTFLSPPKKKQKNAKKHQQQAFSTKIAQATALNGLGLCKRNLPQIYQDFIRGGEAEKSIRNQAVCQRFSVNFGDEFFKIFGWYTVRFTTDFCFRSFRQKKPTQVPNHFVTSTSWREGFWMMENMRVHRGESTPPGPKICPRITSWKKSMMAPFLKIMMAMAPWLLIIMVLLMEEILLTSSYSRYI